MSCKVAIRHPERKGMNPKKTLSITKRRLSQGIYFLHLWIRHGETANGCLPAMNH